jgi:hypothetical protein
MHMILCDKMQAANSTAFLNDKIQLINTSLNQFCYLILKNLRYYFSIHL